MRLFRPLTSFSPSRPFAPSLDLSLLPSIPVVVAFRLCPSRFFIDSNLFHLPPVRSSQHHPGLVPIPLGDIRPCCLHLPSFCRSRLLSLFGAACRHLIACLCDGSLPLPAPVHACDFLFPGARRHSAEPGARVTRRRCEPKRRNRLTPGSNGLQQWARGGPVTAGPTAPYRIRPSVVRDGLTGQCGNGPNCLAIGEMST